MLGNKSVLHSFSARYISINIYTSSAGANGPKVGASASWFILSRAGDSDKKDFYSKTDKLFFKDLAPSGSRNTVPTFIKCGSRSFLPE